MSRVLCSGCQRQRSIDLAIGAPRTPCPECGETAITVAHDLAATVTMEGHLETSLKPGDQLRGWKRRWTEIERELDELLAPRTGGMSADAIHAARHQLHSFYIQAYHLKDALKEEAGTTGLPKKTVEDTITAEPVLALLADLANLDKHGKLNTPPRSGHVPTIVGGSGTASEGRPGWRLDLEILHNGKQLDGLQVAEDAVATWRRVLRGWGVL